MRVDDSAEVLTPISHSQIDRKSKLLDDDDDFDTAPAMQPTVSWKVPELLLERTDVASTVPTSTEISVQEQRMQTVSAAGYVTEYDVPSCPAPLSDVEQALDMTSQAAAVAASVPFFAPQQAAVAVAAPASQYVASADLANVLSPSLTSALASVATAEFVQSLGLPLFLVGQDVQALQTLASSPSLLSTLVGANGMYDEPRLMSLVQTLSVSNGAHGQQAAAPAYMGAPSPYQPPSAGMYGTGAPPMAYGQPPSYPGAPAPRSSRGNSSDGNLHISGYGPTTTQSDIIAFFSPYVIVDEVVMKGTFAFVNTSDPVNAQRAREMLNGSMIEGMPVVS